MWEVSSQHSIKSRLNLDGCTFTNNTNKCGEGGALSIKSQQKSVAKIRKSEFHGIRANGFGGALTVAILSNVTINSSIFLMNSANIGVLIYIAIESRITGRECVSHLIPLHACPPCNMTTVFLHQNNWVSGDRECRKLVHNITLITQHLHTKHIVMHLARKSRDGPMKT